jgi:hypothetical protein
MSSFWKNWLTVWAWGVVVFGAVLAAFAFAPTDGLARAVFTLFGNPVPDAPDNLHRFAVGLMGCVTVGWGLTFMAAHKAAFHLSGKAAASVWKSLLIAAVIWYVIDSWISVATGYAMNAVSNTLLIGLYLIALVKSGVLKGA